MKHFISTHPVFPKATVTLNTQDTLDTQDTSNKVFVSSEETVKFNTVNNTALGGNIKIFSNTNQIKLIQDNSAFSRNNQFTTSKTAIIRFLVPQPLGFESTKTKKRFYTSVNVAFSINETLDSTNVGSDSSAFGNIRFIAEATRKPDQRFTTSLNNTIRVLEDTTRQIFSNTSKHIRLFGEAFSNTKTNFRVFSEENNISFYNLSNSVNRALGSVFSADSNIKTLSQVAASSGQKVFKSSSNNNLVNVQNNSTNASVKIYSYYAVVNGGSHAYGVYEFKFTNDYGEKVYAHIDDFNNEEGLIRVIAVDRTNKWSIGTVLNIYDVAFFPSAQMNWPGFFEKFYEATTTNKDLESVTWHPTISSDGVNIDGVTLTDTVLPVIAGARIRTISNIKSIIDAPVNTDEEIKVEATDIAATIAP